MCILAGRGALGAAAELEAVAEKLGAPIAKALLGNKRNDIVTVEPPRGPKKKLKITKIEKA